MSHAAHNGSKNTPYLKAAALGRNAWHIGKSIEDCPYYATNDLMAGLRRAWVNAFNEKGMLL